MFQPLSEYILQPRESRRLHLDLTCECIEIGGDSRSFRGLLAYHLGTTIEYNKALLCHACHNSKCSNTKHLYWGTDRDNWLDQVQNGTWNSFAERTRSKYGEDKYLDICKSAGSKGGKIGGGSNKLSSEIINSRKKDYEKHFYGRGKYARLAEKWNCSSTQVKRFIKKYIDYPQVG